MMRLNRYLAWCGLASRRKCEALIRAGRVTIDGQIATSLSTNIDEQKQIVTVDGRRIQPPKKFVYIVMNKPAGYVTTAQDELGRKTVMELLPKQIRVFPVGRLDKNTRGVLLFTNDGVLAFQLLHPRFDVDKIYQAEIDKPISDDHVRQLQTGVQLQDGMTHPCQVKLLTRARTCLQLTLHEGRKRQVRRMLQALGYQVVSLIRTQFASIQIGDLKSGHWRYLTDEEVNALKKLVTGKNG